MQLRAHVDAPWYLEAHRITVTTVSDGRVADLVGGRLVLKTFWQPQIYTPHNAQGLVYLELGVGGK